jgi:hypothetical protein
MPAQVLKSKGIKSGIHTGFAAANASFISSNKPQNAYSGEK